MSAVAACCSRDSASSRLSSSKDCSPPTVGTSDRMVPTQSHERSGEIPSMKVSRIPFYARRWPFETGHPPSVLTSKALSHNHKIRDLGAQLPVKQRLANPKALTARPRTSRVRRCRCSLQLDRGYQPIGRAIYPFTYGSDWGEALRLSALEHPRRSIAARAHDSIWHKAQGIRSTTIVTAIRGYNRHAEWVHTRHAGR
jgi:hypothetical protein